MLKTSSKWNIVVFCVVKRFCLLGGYENFGEIFSMNLQIEQATGRLRLEVPWIHVVITQNPIT
jgi:hypothetical protein